MLAVAGKLPRDDERLGATRSSGTGCGPWPAGSRAASRCARATATTSPRAIPELRALGLQLGSTTAVLDGEMVALDERGRAVVRAPAAAHAPGLRGRCPPPRGRGAGHLRALRPAAPGGPLAARRSPTRSGASAWRRWSWRARRGARRRTASATAPALLEASARAGSGGDRGQAPGQPLRARPALARVGQGQAHRPPGAGDRRLGAGPRPARRPRRRPAGRRPRPRRRPGGRRAPAPALRRPRGQRAAPRASWTT